MMDPRSCSANHRELAGRRFLRGSAGDARLGEAMPGAAAPIVRNGRGTLPQPRAITRRVHDVI